MQTIVTRFLSSAFVSLLHWDTSPYGLVTSAMPGCVPSIYRFRRDEVAHEVEGGRRYPPPAKGGFTANELQGVGQLAGETI